MTPETMTVGELIAWAEGNGVDLHGQWIEVLEDAFSQVFPYTARVATYRIGMMVQERGNFTLIPLDHDQSLLTPVFIRYPYLLDRGLQINWARKVKL